MADLSSAPVPPLRDDDHVRGPGDGAPLLVYADLTCPRCAVLWSRLPADTRVCFRHFALRAKHPRALALAHAAEAAGAQGAFFRFLEAVYADQGRVDDPHLWAHVEALGLDLQRFETERRSDAVIARVSRDVHDALRAGAVATPTTYAADEAQAAMLAGIGFEASRTTPGTDGRGRE